MMHRVSLAFVFMHKHAAYKTAKEDTGTCSHLNVW